MSTNEKNTPRSWKRPDEILKLQRLKQKKKQLAARFNNKSNNNDRAEIAESDKVSALQAKIVQKRKNPFAKCADNDAKKPKTDGSAQLEQDDSLLAFVDTTPKPLARETFVSTTPSRSPPAKLVLQPFDPKAFAQILQQSAVGGEDDELQEQQFTKHLPMDWSLKTRVRFFCASELPATALRSSQMASGLTGFVRCMDGEHCSNGLDISPATRLNQSTYYWQHPYIPWMTLFPRNSKDNTGITLGERERTALISDWDSSFCGLFQLLRARQCPYFYLCANTFTVLFRAAGTGGCVETHAVMTPTTRGMRCALRQEGIEYSMPLKKELGLTKSGDGSFSEEKSRGNAAEIEASNSNSSVATVLADADVDEEDGDDDDWLASLGVDEKEIRRIKSAHSRQIKTKEMSDDFSENSLILIEGGECQGFYSFLLNAKSTISSVGRLAGVPPTLLAPVAFPKATIQQLSTRSNKVRMDGVDYHSIEVKGIVLPTFLPYVCHLLAETKSTFSATMASSNSTLAFSKATQRLIENKPQQNHTAEGGEPQQSLDDANELVGQVFGQENLSDCGLLPHVIESICRTGQSAVGLLERVCYDKDHGFAWS